MKKNKRKICFIITNFIHYSRNFLILDALRKKNNIELHIILGGMVISPRYISSHFNVRDILVREGYKNIHEVYIDLEGDNHVVKTKTIGLGVLEFASLFNSLKPDLVVVRGDRFEMLAAAVAAANMNITLAHIEGGDITGTIDESIRHAITKLAHYHFTTNRYSRKRVIRMGEDENMVFDFGSPDIEIVKKLSGRMVPPKSLNLAKVGSGMSFDLTSDFLMVMYHPVTSETEKLSKHTKNLLEAVHDIGMQILWFWPNFDAGAEKISHEMRSFREKTKNLKIRFLRYLPPAEFIFLLNKTKCLVGNSSSGVKECSYLGIPVVNVGTRQRGRLKAKNVLNCGDTKLEILNAIKRQLKKDRYGTSHIYFSHNTSKKIANVLSSCNLTIQKYFKD